LTLPKRGWREGKKSDLRESILPAKEGGSLGCSVKGKGGKTLRERDGEERMVFNCVASFASCGEYSNEAERGRGDCFLGRVPGGDTDREKRNGTMLVKTAEGRGGI